MARVIARHSTRVTQVEPDLTLDGLRILHGRNSEPVTASKRPAERSGRTASET
jgi:hypothetical protein